MKNPSEKNKKFLKALNLAKTLKTTTHKESLNECWDGYVKKGMKKKGNRMVPNCVPKNENIDPKAQAKHKGKAAPYGSAYEPVKEGDTYEKWLLKVKKEVI